MNNQPSIPAKTIQKFYEGKTNANILLNLSHTEKKRDTALEFTIDNILYDWTDYQLHTNPKYIDWITPEINKHLFHQFTLKSPVMKANLIGIVLRYIELIGYRMNPQGKLEPYLPLIRKEKDITVGLANSNIYKNITRLFNLLNSLKFNYLSAVLFLAIIQATSENNNIREIVISKPDIIEWISFQTYLDQKETEAALGIVIDDWERDFDLGLNSKNETQINYDTW